MRRGDGERSPTGAGGHRDVGQVVRLDADLRGGGRVAPPGGVDGQRTIQAAAQIGGVESGRDQRIRPRRRRSDPRLRGHGAEAGRRAGSRIARVENREGGSRLEASEQRPHQLGAASSGHGDHLASADAVVAEPASQLIGPPVQVAVRPAATRLANRGAIADPAGQAAESSVNELRPALLRSRLSSAQVAGETRCQKRQVLDAAIRAGDDLLEQAPVLRQKLGDP